MNTYSHPARHTARRSSLPPPSSPAPVRRGPEVEQDFDTMESAAATVEHLTVPGFIRRIPHRFSFDDIARFGDKVGRAAESLHLSYISTVDQSLGMIRMFPVRLMERVYAVMSRAHRWPEIIELPAAPELTDRRADEQALRAHERLAEHLTAVLDHASDLDVQHSATVLLGWLEAEIGRLRSELHGSAEVDSPDAAATGAR